MDGGTVTREATAEEAGEITYKCSVCGFIMNAEELPPLDEADGKKGVVEKEEEQGENAPPSKLTTPLDELIAAVLTPEELEQVGAGDDIVIVLSVENLQEDVSEDDQAKVEEKLGDYSLGSYLDINLYKVINNTEKDRITQTSEKIRITIDIPEEFRNTGRDFVIIRVHDGEAVILEDLDDDDDTITIETDKFSTYTLAYRDGGADEGNNAGSTDDKEDTPGTAADDNVTGNGGGEDKPEGGADDKDPEPKTGDISHIAVYASVAMIAGLSSLMLYYGSRKRGMQAQNKSKFVAALTVWGRRGGRLRRYTAIAVIFIILAYYRSIGKLLSPECKELYEK